MMESENALKEFKSEHAEGIAATKAEFVKFLREGNLPDEDLDLVALYIYVGNRAGLSLNPKRGLIPAGNFFGNVVQDGVYGCIERWENPKKYAALMDCPECGGEGDVPKTKTKTATRKTGGKLSGKGI